MAATSPGIRDRIVELRRVKGRDLLVNPKNWRRHPQAQRDALKGVLAEIGYADALLARETPDGLMLIDGHLRAGISRNQEVPVLVLDLDEVEADKLLATLDPLAAMAMPDQDKLLALLSSVQFESQAVNALLEALANGETQPMPTPGLTDPDDVPEAPAEPWVKRGDVFQLGEHRVMCGDSTDKDNVAVLLDGIIPGICVTDPPYGVNYAPLWRNEKAAQGYLAFGSRRKEPVTNDDRADWSEAWRLFPGDVLYSYHPAAEAKSLIHAQAIEESGFTLRMQIIWAKSNFPIGRGDYHVRHEPCWYAVRTGKPAKRTDDRTQTTLWEINLDKNVPGDHSTQKPVECMARPIRNHTFREVYDPFLGSGTTLIACEKLGRICYGMEIEPRYVQVSLERWEAYTGRKATKETA